MYRLNSLCFVGSRSLRRNPAALAALLRYCQISRRPQYLKALRDLSEVMIRSWRSPNPRLDLVLRIFVQHEPSRLAPFRNVGLCHPFRGATFQRIKKGCVPLLGYLDRFSDFIFALHGLLGLGPVSFFLGTFLQHSHKAPILTLYLFLFHGVSRYQASQARAARARAATTLSNARALACPWSSSFAGIGSTLTCPACMRCTPAALAGPWPSPRLPSAIAYCS